MIAAPGFMIYNLCLTEKFMSVMCKQILKMPVKPGGRAP